MVNKLQKFVKKTVSVLAVVGGATLVLSPLGWSLINWTKDFVPYVLVLAGVSAVFAGIALWRGK